MHHPLRDIQADFQMNRPTRYQIIPQKEIIDTDGQTDGQTAGRTDGRTDVAYDNKRYFFFEKRKKLLKMIHYDMVYEKFLKFWCYAYL